MSAPPKGKQPHTVHVKPSNPSSVVIGHFANTSKTPVARLLQSQHEPSKTRINVGKLDKSTIPTVSEAGIATSSNQSSKTPIINTVKKEQVIPETPKHNQPVLSTENTKNAIKSILHMPHTDNINSKTPPPAPVITRELLNVADRPRSLTHNSALTQAIVAKAQINTDYITLNNVRRGLPEDILEGKEYNNAIADKKRRGIGSTISPNEILNARSKKKEARAIRKAHARDKKLGNAGYITVKEAKSLVGSQKTKATPVENTYMNIRNMNLPTKEPIYLGIGNTKEPIYATVKPRDNRQPPVPPPLPPPRVGSKPISTPPPKNTGKNLSSRANRRRARKLERKTSKNAGYITLNELQLKSTNTPSPRTLRLETNGESSTNIPRRGFPEGAITNSKQIQKAVETDFNMGISKMFNNETKRASRKVSSKNIFKTENNLGISKMFNNTATASAFPKPLNTPVVPAPTAEVPKPVNTLQQPPAELSKPANTLQQPLAEVPSPARPATTIAKTAALKPTNISNYKRLSAKKKRELYRLKKATAKPRLAGLSFFVKNILGFDGSSLLSRYTNFVRKPPRTEKEIRESLDKIQNELELAKQNILQKRQTRLSNQDQLQMRYITKAQKQLQDRNAVNELVNEMMRNQSIADKKANTNIASMFPNSPSTIPTSAQKGGRTHKHISKTRKR